MTIGRMAAMGISIGCICAGGHVLHARQQTPAAGWASLQAEWIEEPTGIMSAHEPRGNRNDPAYTLYKEGYNLVLDERWEEARKKFARLVKSYPSSEYVDDAAYWSAYSLMHLDKKKALEAYQRFINRFPDSQYYDDAIADLSDLKPALPAKAGGSDGSPGVYVTTGNHLFTLDSMSGSWTSFNPHSDSEIMRNMGKIEGNIGRNRFGYRFKYGQAPPSKQLTRALQLQAQTLKSIRLPRTPAPLLAPGTLMDDNDLDQETRLKIEALEALGSGKHDSTSFRALRDIAVNRSQNSKLRAAAMEQLIEFKKYDVLPVFLEIAKKDTSREIQNAAIDYIGMLTNDKNRSVETLIELFDVIPRSRSDQRENIFYSIAEVGNDRAVDFLAKVARAHEDYDLRSEAVYYLGCIGNDRARAALYEILREK